MQERRLLSTDTIIGDDVVDMQGEDIGKVDDLMIDLGRGCIAYGIIKFGRWADASDRLFPVPFDVLNVDFENERIVMNFNRDDLRDAPRFDENNWPDLGNTMWGRDVYEYYGVQPYWETLKRGI